MVVEEKRYAKLKRKIRNKLEGNWGRTHFSLFLILEIEKI